MLLSLSFGAQAGLIDNGLTTIDDVSGLEWLDLTETAGLSIADVEAGAGGFIADGWSVANLNQICSLFGNVTSFDEEDCNTEYRNGTLSASGTNYLFGPDASVTPIISLLGNVGGNNWTLGTFDASLVGYSGYACLYEGTGGGCASTGAPGGFVLDNYFSNANFNWSAAGVYLVKGASVPTPATLAIFGLGMIAFGFRRKGQIKA